MNLANHFFGVKTHASSSPPSHNSSTGKAKHRPALVEEASDVRSDYIFDKLIGKGTFGEVFAAVNRQTGKRVVIKKVPNAQMRKCELEAGRRLNHPCVPKLYGHYESDLCHYMAMEYMPGEDLFSHFERRKFTPMDEMKAKKIFRELCKAVHHAHQKGIVHRDIKLENILLDAKNKVSLIDWGLCDFVSRDKDILSGRVGSLEYVSPEVLTSKVYCGTKTDIYSLGVILFILLYAVFPFDTTERVMSVHQKKPHPPVIFPTTTSGKSSDEEEKSIEISEDARELIQKLLDVNPLTRPSIEQVLSHKWLKTDFLSWLSWSS